MVQRSIRLKEMRPGIDLLREPAAEYLARVDPCLELGPYRTRTDDDGFLMTGNRVQSSAPPLVFLGDSFVESMYSYEDLRFVSVIERGLIESGVEVRCLNGGYSGATSLQLFNVLVNKILPIVGAEGCVVFFLPQSDANVIHLPSTYWNASKRNTTIVPGREPSATELPRGVEATRAILRLVVKACEFLNIRLVLAISPFRVSDFETDALLPKLYPNAKRYNHSQTLRSELAGVAAQVAGDTGTPLLDIRLGGDPCYFYDELHLSALGQKVFSELAIEQLIEVLS